MVTGVGAAPIVSVTIVEVLAAKLLDPLNEAVRLWVELGAKLETDNVATDPLKLADPREVVPSRNVTFPANVPELAVTLAVSTTVAFAGAGFWETDKTVLVDAGAGEGEGCGGAVFELEAPPQPAHSAINTPQRA